MKPKAVKKTEGKPKKDKSQSKRMKTFNSSQFQLWDQKNKAMKASATDLTILKQQTIVNRRQQNKSALSMYNGSKGNTTKITMKKKKKTVITKSKTKLKKLDEQQFQKVKYKQSNSHSQIVFSNDQTKRESCISNIELKNVRHIQSISNYQYDSNLILRVSIKRQYMRKVEAATKIQKVFRGYMTRKILMKYIKDEQERLKSRLADNLNSDFDEMHQNQTNRTFVDKEGEYLLNRLFENKAIGDNNVNHTMKARVEDLQQSSQQDQEAHIKNKVPHINKNYPRRKQDMINFASQGKNWIQRQNQQQESQQTEQEEEDEDQATNMIYKRQNPIYSQEQISHYLESSDQECEQELQDAYEPDIIFQTNQEYIQSRKSSLQNKNQTINKLSNKGISDLALIGNFDQRIRKQLRESDGAEKIRSRSQKKEDYEEEIKDKVQQSQTQKIQITQKTQILEVSKNISKQQKQEQKFFGVSDTQRKQQNNQIIEKKQNEEIKQNLQEKQIALDKKEVNQDVFETIVVDFQDEQSNKKKQLQKEKSEEKQPKKFEKLKIPEKRKDQSQQKNQSHRSNHSQGHSQRQKQISPRRDVKYLDEQYLVSNQSSANSCRSNRSKKSVEQQQIIKLRELQCQKWDEVIRMVSQQIRKNEQNNGQIVNFMKTIMEFSQKNKQLLGSTRSVNSQSEAFTTPTSMGAGFFNSIEPKDRSNQGKNLDSGQKSENIKNQPSEENSSGFKFFKKKKPLKIELSDENNLDEQKESTFLQISESKKQTGKFDFPKQKEFVRSKTKNQQFLQKSPIYRFHKNEPFSLEEKKIMKNQVQNMNQNSKTLKNFLSTNIQVQDDAINDILKLREQLLQKRQSQQLVKLNNQLSSNKLTQQQFLQKLSNLTRKFHEQKQTIDKAKQDIIKGYQAANDLVKEYFYDVRRMGIKLAVSRSQDNIKYKFTTPSYFNGDIKIDQLTPKSTPKSTPKAGQKRMSVKQIFAQHQIYQQKSKQKSSNFQNIYQQSSQDSIQFTQQQLKRFRKAANYDLEFNDLNRNMTTISDQFIKQQRKPFHDQNSNQNQNIKFLTQSPQSHRQPKDILPQRQTYLLQQQKAPSTRTPPHVQAIIQHQINILIWQFATQLLIRPAISDKFVDKASLIKPAQITHQQRLQFLTILQQNLPDKINLHRKLNQNITPLPCQILKCMRLDFSQQDPNLQEDDDQNYQQINKYQFVISQQSCAKSVMLFKNSIDQVQQLKQIDQIRKKNQLLCKFQENIKYIGGGIGGVGGNQQKIQKFINQRQTFLKNRKQHTRQLRWQVMNIQLHCIFDSWNQEIIQLCSQRSGFSGIGLNQLTLSMINHNKPIHQNKCQNVVLQAKQKVIEILTDDTDLNAKILRENFHQMCQNDSAWVFYADEALSYALQLVYLIQEDIYAEVARQFRKIIMKNTFSV